MADLIKKIKIKKQDGTFTDYIPIGAEAQNISTSDGDSVQLKLNKKPYYYNSVADMKADLKLKAGDMAITLGYYAPKDGGRGEYKIVGGTHTDDGGSYHQLNNSLYAELNSRELNPELFGAYGDGTHDDHDALLKCITYACSRIVGRDNNNYSSWPIKFNTKKYLNNSRIELSSLTHTCNCLNLDGNQAWLLGNGFYFAEDAGWQVHIKNLNFADMTTAIELAYRNLEYGNYIFDNLILRAISMPFKVNRRSCIVEIRNCMFKGVSGIGEFYDNDRLYFHHNWVEPGTVTNEDYKSMLKQTAGNEGAMFIYNNLFVPVSGTNCKELCWIEVNEHARIYNNRFGGENINYHPLRVGAGFWKKSESTEATKHAYLSFDHNDEVSGNCSIILESLCGNMLFTDNQGWISGHKMFEWSDKISLEQQTTLIRNASRMLNFVVRDNVGRNTFRGGKDNQVANDYKPTIPDNLYGIINRGPRSIIDKGGENAAYLEYLAPSKNANQIITIQKQPFGNITSASTSGFFENVSNFALLMWCGYGYNTNYECKTTYALITFEMISSTTNIKMTMHFLGESLPITATFVDTDTDTIDATTLTNATTLQIKFSATESNKVIKYLKANIFRPKNDLTAFI